MGIKTAKKKNKKQNVQFVDFSLHERFHFPRIVKKKVCKYMYQVFLRTLLANIRIPRPWAVERVNHNKTSQLTITKTNTIMTLPFDSFTSRIFR